jgi:nucleoside-diphosphate-sugar epimerase
MANILIIGCGYVGCELAKAYINKGDQVWALQRHSVDVLGVNNIIADAMTVDNLPNVDVIFYMIAADKHDKASYEKAYVHCLDNILKLIPLSSEPKFVFISSTAVYGQQHGEWVDETSPTVPNDFSGKILLEAESLVRKNAKNYAIVRFGGIYGPQRERMIRLVKEDNGQTCPQEVYTNRIHLADCVGILQFIAGIRKNEIYLGVDNEPALYNEILLWLGQILKKEIRAGKETPQRLQLSQKRCSNLKIRQLGYHFIHPNYKSGYLSILNNYI